MGYVFLLYVAYLWLHDFMNDLIDPQENGSKSDNKKYYK